MGKILFVLLLLFYFHVNSSSSTLPSSSLNSAPLCLPGESSALLQFKSNFFLDLIQEYPHCGTSFPKTNSWNETTNCCLWEGVTCDNLTAHVVALDLSCSSLSGPLSANSSLFLLQQLQQLNLAYNHFNGSLLPDILSRLVNLTHLNLSFNEFSGLIPDVFGSLNKLDVLDLSSSNFSGPIPLTIFNLPQVTLLNLSSNSLEGELPAHANGLQNLERLDLSQNLLSGPVPSWLLVLPSLNKLDLSENKLLTLPTDDQIQKPNSALEEIYLRSNEIYGSIPIFFFDIVNLTDLDLSSNNLSGVITSEMLSKPRRLQTLDLSNNKIEGSISKWESEGCEQLIRLNLSYNSLSSFEQFPGQNLEVLDVRSNQLRGPILAPPPSLKILIISNNSLTGEIPTLICSLSFLEVLDLSINKLGGTIPACLANSSPLFLSDINLGLNNFHGQIPAFDSLQLQTLLVNDNQLEGLLPRSLVNCSSLVFLNVANNRINDTFPHWLGTLPKLQVLVLRANRFHGTLENATAPYSFSSEKIIPNIAPDPFSSLKIIDLSQNALTGTLPTNFLQSLMAMKFGNTIWPCDPSYRACVRRNNGKSVEVVIKRLQVELQLGGTLPGFTIIDFSYNKFYGGIPDVLGGLGSLNVLNLSYNQFTGSIPPLLGHMEELESLDLSSNKLGGRIPSELTNLTFLEVLNLSQNNLVGQIPQGKQFNTFDSDSYRGNPGLWGCPLSKKCRSIPEPPPSSIVDQDDDDDDSGIAFIWKVAGMGYGCGVVLGLSMGYIVFTTGRPWWIVRMIERDWQKNVTNWIRRIRGR